MLPLVLLLLVATTVDGQPFFVEAQQATDNAGFSPFLIRRKFCLFLKYSNTFSMSN